MKRECGAREGEAGTRRLVKKKSVRENNGAMMDEGRRGTESRLLVTWQPPWRGAAAWWADWLPPQDGRNTSTAGKVVTVILSVVTMMKITVEIVAGRQGCLILENQVH